MTGLLEKAQNVDGNKLNGSAVALLALVLFFYGNHMRALPETVADMARVQALLVYRIEQLERVVATQGHSSAPVGAPSVSLSGAPGGDFHGLGNSHPARPLDLAQAVPVRLQLDHLGSR